MNYTFVSMSKDFAVEIAYMWKYSGIYSFYDMTADKEDLKDFLNEESWERYFAVVNDEKELVGYYSFYFEEGIMWIGFGLKPELTGKRHGPEFVIAGINYLIQKLNYEKSYVMLSVATFNKRAIKAYEKIGFQGEDQFIQRTNGGEYKFLRMKKYI